MASIYAQNRMNGLFQVDEQREPILKAAQTLFLEKGIEKTTMGEIAKRAGIHRVTFYRYFPDRHPIAFEIAVRMMKLIMSRSDVSDSTDYLQAAKFNVSAMIDQFHDLRDAYRYISMFDSLYVHHYPDEKISTWFKNEISTLGWGSGRLHNLNDHERSHIVMIMNATVSFLERLAARGDLMAIEQGVAIDTELANFRCMINLYFDSLITEAAGKG